MRPWFKHNGERFCPTACDGVAAGEPGVATGSRPPANAVIGAVGGDGRDRLISGDLRQQAGQHGCVAHGAVGYLDRTHFHSRLVDAEVDLAPYLPRATVGTTSAASYMSLLSRDVA